MPTENDYQQGHRDGYEDSLDTIEDAITQSIARHNNARSLTDVLNVYNDIVHHLHAERAKVFESKQRDFSLIGRRFAYQGGI